MFFKYFLTIFFVCIVITSKSQVFIVDTAYTPKEMVNNYFLNNNQNGIEIENINYSGLKLAIGLFYYEGNYNAFPQYGLVLSSGSVLAAVGPNNHTSSFENYTKGDVDLSEIVNSKTFDSAILEFDFASFTDSINFIFQFASEEYPEYVKKGVSDVFGFLITDCSNNKMKNIAVLSHNNTPVAIDMINKSSNSDFYNSNNSIEYRFKGNKKEDAKYSENLRLFQFDGFTKAISSGIKLEPFKKYHFKIAIADVGDRKFDSWIFLKGNSFISNGNILNPDYKDVIKYFENIENDSLEIYTYEQQLHIMLPIYFSYNSWELEIESNEILKPLLNILTYSNYNLIINGFADKTGASNYNLELSKKRSNQVKKYLMENGIKEFRISSFGKGEINSETNFKKSRKVEFILY